MAERGEIRNRKYATQIKDFRKLRWGNITPTDIDLPPISMFIDFDNRLFIIGELKYGDTDLPYGQILALERLCDTCERGGVPTYALIASHTCEGDIDVAEAIVTEYRNKGKWQKPGNKITVLEAINKIRGWYGIL